MYKQRCLKNNLTQMVGWGGGGGGGGGGVAGGGMVTLGTAYTYEAGLTLAGEIVHLVDAGRVVSTRLTVAFVDVCRRMKNQRYSLQTYIRAGSIL